MPRARTAGLLACVCFASLVVPGASHAAQPQREIRLPHFAGSTAERSYSSRWVPDHVSGFGLVGLSSYGSTEEAFATGWSLAGGVEIPVASNWSLVPRAVASACSGGGSGSQWWARALAAGRVSSLSHRRVSYFEAGVGLGVLDESVSDFPSDVPTNRQATSWAPVVHVAHGDHSQPDLGPGWMLEINMELGLNRSHPLAIDLAAGLAF